MAAPRNSALLAGLAIATSLLAIAGALGGSFWLIASFKPLATMLLLASAISSWRYTKQSFAFWISLGLFFSLIGDIFLLWPGKFFVPGLAAFLLTHLAYILGFTRDAKFPARWFVWLIFLAIAAANFFVLRPNLPSGLVLPVAIYALALASMTAQAAGRFVLLRTLAAKLAAIGAVFFLISDTLLAWDRFHSPLSFASTFILVSYYIAQLLITLSTRPLSSPSPPSVR